MDRLATIIGNDAYHYGAKLHAVELYEKEPGGSTIIVNKLADSPKIIVSVFEGSGEESTKDGRRSLTLTLRAFMSLLGQPSGDREISQAIADMKRALFSMPNLFGVEAYDVSHTEGPMALEEKEAVIDGAEVTVTFSCEDNIAL